MVWSLYRGKSFTLLVSEAFFNHILLTFMLKYCDVTLPPISFREHRLKKDAITIFKLFLSPTVQSLYRGSSCIVCEKQDLRQTCVRFRMLSVLSFFSSPFLTLSFTRSFHSAASTLGTGTNALMWLGLPAMFTSRTRFLSTFSDWAEEDDSCISAVYQVKMDRVRR